MLGVHPDLYKPLARQRGLLSTELAGDLVIVDTDRNRGISLNPVLAQLFRLSNGQNSIRHIAQQIAVENNAKPDTAAIWVGLRKLEKAKLLEGDVPFPDLAEADLRSRRQALKVMGLGAGALAMILLPLPADAATCFANGIPCTTDAQCCSGRCCIHSSHACGTGGPGC